MVTMAEHSWTTVPHPRAVVLAAGLGRRLRADRPKPLAEIATGETLLGNLVNALAPEFGRDRITLVLGHGADIIRTEFPDLPFVLNPRFAGTNTAKSLQIGLSDIDRANDVLDSENMASPAHGRDARATVGAEAHGRDIGAAGVPVRGDVLWVNADLYVDAGTVRRFIAAASLGSRALVNRAPVAAEEVKYSLSDAGAVSSIGKHVENAAGEALGMNIVAGADMPAFVAALHAASDQDYFEAAMDHCIQSGVMRIAPFDVGAVFCKEVDTPADLAAVREHVAGAGLMKGGES